MSIPKLLALDIKYNISEKELEKTVSLRLNINKDKFNQINVSRREKNMSEITLDQVQKLVVKGKVEFKDNTFKYNIDPSEDEKELFSEIESLLEISVNYFKLNKTEFLNLAPNFYQLMESKNYQQIINEYYLKFKENDVKKEIGNEFFENLDSGKDKYSLVHKTILNEPLKQLKELLLPAFYDNKDEQFYKELDKWNNQDIYKYLVYLPNEYMWEIPIDMENKVIKPGKVNMKIRYLSMEEINDNGYLHLLEEESYLSNLNKTIFEKEIHLNTDKPFENNWSDEDFKQNNGIIETNIMPKIFVNENNELDVSRPGDVKNRLLRLFFGIHNKFFESKIIKQEDASLFKE